MTFKKVIGKAHLWLGLASGLIVLFLGITGCILAFQLEIEGLTQKFRFVKIEDKPYLAPSELKKVAEQHLVSKTAFDVEYPGKGRAATAMYYDESHYEMVFMNPYTGEFLQHKNMNRDFFRFIINGHYYLWLPPHIGQPILASATLIFLIMMITGLILWWPRNKAARKQRFTIKWTARWRRKNYDLHNVLGFYITWVAIFIALSGLVMGFQWFAKSVYWVSSGGQSMVAHDHPHSDTLQTAKYNDIADRLWDKHRTTVKDNEGLSVWYALTKDASVEVVVNHRPGTYYKSDYHFYDQYTGEPLKGTGAYAGTYKEASGADKLVRMNYDIHVGAILGLPGKIMAFFASLIAASLPVTGFMIWWGRRRKSRQSAVGSGQSSSAETLAKAGAVVSQ
ncbi:MAG TPA: PepSY-associated TM helix domain-containing protein [Chitinophagaceae bacterium]|nr:PepSY-associated TM helix domain-containing protein [Chitinophagaceae bacterium]